MHPYEDVIIAHFHRNVQKQHLCRGAVFIHLPEMLLIDTPAGVRRSDTLAEMLFLPTPIRVLLLYILTGVLLLYTPVEVLLSYIPTGVSLSYTLFDVLLSYTLTEVLLSHILTKVSLLHGPLTVQKQDPLWLRPFRRRAVVHQEPM